MKLSEKIVMLRKEKDWNQEELGKAIGISHKHISRYENEKTDPSLHVIKKLSEVFNVSTDYLLFEEAPRETRFHIFDPVFVKFLENAEGLPEEDRRTVKGVLSAVLVKNRIEDVIQVSQEETGRQKERPALRKVAGRR
jgi:transcriptional regulator with XRE-family HTH domain